MKSLKLAGITEAYVVIGYMGQEIVKTIGDYFTGVKVHYIKNLNWSKGNLYSLLAAEGILGENFILCMANHIFDCRIIKALQSITLTNILVLAVDRVVSQHFMRP